MKELFLSVLTLSLTSSILLVPLLVFSKKLRFRYAAKTLYFLWLLLAVRMVLPQTFILPSAPLTVELPGYTMRIPASPPTAPAAPEAPAFAWESDDTATYTQTQIEEAIVFQPQARSSWVQPVAFSELAAAVWLAGIAVFLLWQIAAYFWARWSILRESCPSTDEEWALLGRLCADLGVGKAMNLCRSSRVASPMMLGLFSPILVLPDWDSDQDDLEAVLRHELCHLKRGDVAYKSFFLLVNAVHWFNPLVWLMAREAARNVEFCCDDEVLRHADGPTRKHYGEVLLNTAAGSIYPAFSTHFGSGKEQLKERLLNLFRPKKNSALLVFAILAVALLAGGAVAFEDRQGVQTPTMDSPAVTAVEKPPVPTTTANAESALGIADYELYYALALPDIESDDFETVTFHLANYDPESGTVWAIGETQTLTMADDVRLSYGAEEDAVWAGEKGALERQRALLKFLDWPLLRSTYYGNRTDFMEVIVENGRVAQMTLLMTPETDEPSITTTPVPALSMESDSSTKPDSAINLPTEGKPEVTAEPLQPDMGEGKPVIELSSGGQSSIIKSASFKAEAGQTLTLTITSDISGGTVDLFLFSPAGQEQHITMGGEDITREITLTEGTWAYNCTGFFERGDISIVGTVK